MTDTRDNSHCITPGAADRNKHAAALSLVRSCHKLIRESVPGAERLRWTIDNPFTDSPHQMISMTELAFLDKNGNELYGHTMLDGAGNFEIRYTKPFACSLLGKPLSYFSGPEELYTREVFRGMAVAFDAAMNLAQQAYTLRGRMAGDSDLLPSGSPVTQPGFRDTDAPGPSH